jgi:ankyrin repeat protein
VRCAGARVLRLHVGASALHYAVMKGEMPLVSLLLQRGADVNSRTKSGTTPLHTAVLYRRTEIAEYLLDKGADVNAKSAGGTTPLGLALAANYHTLEQLLRKRGGQ